MFNVLVCDDDKEIVEAIEIYLRQEGYNVLKAYDGQEAIKVLDSTEVDLLIIDVMMPKLDGIRATLKMCIRDRMNSLSRSILNLYSYDEKADDTSIPNVLRQCLNLISQFPMLMVYGYHAYHYRMGEDLFIYAPDPALSTAENILMMLRKDKMCIRDRVRAVKSG